MQNFMFVPIGTNSGLVSVALGMAHALQQQGHFPVYYKPLTPHEDGDHDPSSHFARRLLHIEVPMPITVAQAEALIGAGDYDDLIESIVANFHEHIPQNSKVAVIEGLYPDSERSYFSEINQEIAQALDAQIIWIVNGKEATPKQIADQINLEMQDFNGRSNRFAGYIINKYTGSSDAGACADFCAEVNAHLLLMRLPEMACLGMVPYAPHRSARRMYDIARFLNAPVLRGERNLKKRRVSEIVVAGQSATHMAHRIVPGALIVVPGDREDVLMAVALKTLAGVPFAGLMLTGDTLPSNALLTLVQPALKDEVPVLLSPADTYQTAYKLAHQNDDVPLDDTERMADIMNYVAENVDIDSVCAHLGDPASTRLTPPAFRYNMMEKSRRADKRIVLPEGSEPRTVQAAVICHQKGIARCVLLAKKAEVKMVAESLGLSLPESLEIIDPDSVRSCYVEPMVQLRKNKGLTAIQAEQQLEDTVVIGTMMLALDEVDGLVSGAVHTTANTVRPAMQLIKTAPGTSLVSSIFFMLMPEQVLVYGDCAINPNPNAEELADIAIQSADSARAFGIEPKVAMISYSTGTSGSGEEVEKVKQATAIAKQKRPDLIIDGPLQYDAASVPSVGRQKAPDSPVAGQATVFVFPDLNTGNTTYKAVQRSANVLSIGPMLQGLNKPVNDLSRGALVDDIVYTIAITAIQATQMDAARAP